jgi:hypothetical protein
MSAANFLHGIEAIMNDLVGSRADRSFVPVLLISSESCIFLVVLIIILPFIFIIFYFDLGCCYRRPSISDDLPYQYANHPCKILRYWFVVTAKLKISLQSWDQVARSFL